MSISDHLFVSTVSTPWIGKGTEKQRGCGNAEGRKAFNYYIGKNSIAEVGTSLHKGGI